MHDVETLPNSGDVKILIVEDEFLIAMETEAVLTENGYCVIGTAPSIEKAMEFLENFMPDIAILDVNLRGKSIFPVAVLLKAMAVPFIFASAYSPNNHDGLEIFKDVVNVGKPIREKILVDALRAVFPIK